MTSAWARLWSSIGARLGLGTAGTAPAAVPPVDARLSEANLSDELAKLQRGLRRLGLAHEHHTELLQGISARLQDLDQNVMRLALPGRREVPIDEDTLLRCLDRLDRSLAQPGLPAAAGESLRALNEALVSAAGWRAVAVVGAEPEGIHLRIAEVLPDPDIPHFRIRHIIEQGYLRADGGALRPAVVVVAGPRAASGEDPRAGEPA
jgi:hypothetical protein